MAPLNSTLSLCEENDPTWITVTSWLICKVQLANRPWQQLIRFPYLWRIQANRVGMEDSHLKMTEIFENTL